MKMGYLIGQVLFVVLNKKNQIYPMQVIEIITKKTLKGEEVQYLLQGGADRTSTVMLNQVDGEIFDSSDKARKTLIDRATKQVNRLMDIAVAKSKEWYSLSESSEPQSIEDLPDFEPNVTITKELPEDVTTVMMSDGTVAKIKLPSI